MRFLLRVNPIQHTRCSRHTRLIILSLSTKQRTVGGGRNGDWKRSKGRRGRRLEEDLIQKTGRSWHKDEKQSSESPQGLGSPCRHNEQSQTYPASLISTIKAIFSAQHAASSAVCESPHLSHKDQKQPEMALG